MASSPVPSGSSALPSPQAEAARYALIRRLAPSMRHHLVVNLQPIGMIYEVMERRLRAPTPDLAHVQDSAGKINGFARAALASCLDVVGWLAPDDTATATVDDVVRECAGLLATSLSFRGYALRNQVSSLPGAIRRSGARTLLTAALIHCTDHLPAPADLVITGDAGDGGAQLTIEFQPTPGEHTFGSEANYRKLAWVDLHALAVADGIGVETNGTQAVRLRLPWA
ncbi:hypothetical protein WG902_15940 [Ramlibacter sp. PS3R-8]|uniref:hypothetical protein n=1 Tax=Ramlibacter sp. PS3R-8 TaxID=3133437 RepID=UPI0030A3CFE8